MPANQENKLSEYETQAILFLRKHKLNFISRYTGYGKHFSKDDSNRDIYRITLSTIKAPFKKATFTFGQSEYDSKTGTPPTEYDLLACLTKYDPGTFENFCSDMGYDTDSITARESYNAVKREWEKVSKFFAGMGTALSELEEIN